MKRSNVVLSIFVGKGAEEGRDRGLIGTIGGVSEFVDPAEMFIVPTIYSLCVFWTLLLFSCLAKSPGEIRPLFLAL